MKGCVYMDVNAAIYLFAVLLLIFGTLITYIRIKLARRRIMRARQRIRSIVDGWKWRKL